MAKAKTKLELTPEEQHLADFRTERSKKLGKIFSDNVSTKRGMNQTPVYSARTYNTATEVRKALSDAITYRTTIVETSNKLYATNPVYAMIINYLANIYMWRYKVTPHKVYTKSKAKARKQLGDEDFALIYNLMLEAVDGLSIETKFPQLLTYLFINGGIYLTTICDEDAQTVDTLVLPDKFCRKTAETQFGTAIIEFDFSYFDSLGMSNEDLQAYLKMFPAEFQKDYRKYVNNMQLRWQQLDPCFSTGILLNDMSIPTWFYLYGGILDYEQYQDNELERNSNLLKYLVVQKMPIYQDKLVLEVDEAAALHRSVASVVNAGEKTRLVTTYADLHVEQLGEKDTAENKTLSNAFKAIFNNAGFNNTIFTGDSVEALKMSILRDRSMIWRYVKAFLNFYTIAINNWFDFKSYQADIDILPISIYTYDSDVEVFKNNATLGVGKLDYFIASGIKQKNIQDQLNLERFLKLDTITPMQTSYTQTADDRLAESNQDTSEEAKTSEKSEIEPSEE